MDKFIVKIYVAGVMSYLKVRGKENLGKLRQEIAAVLGADAVRDATSFPPTDPSYDFYYFTKEQFLKFNGKRD